MVHRFLALPLFGVLGLVAFDGFEERRAAADRSATTLTTEAPAEAAVQFGGNPWPPPTAKVAVQFGGNPWPPPTAKVAVQFGGNPWPPPTAKVAVQFGGNPWPPPT